VFGSRVLFSGASLLDRLLSRCDCFFDGRPLVVIFRKLLSQPTIFGHFAWPKKVVGIGRAICYLRSAIVQQFFENSN
jgi:hypothetical protein